MKKDDVMFWRIELSCCNFDIVYRPGAENIAPDTFFFYFLVLQSQLVLI